MTYGNIIGYSNLNGTYTETECTEQKSDAVDSAIATIRNAGTERIWLVGNAAPAAPGAEGNKYLDNQSGKYYAYSSGEWAKISELGMATNSLETPYGSITAEYMSSPMVVFKYENGDWTFVAGFDSYYEMNDAIRGFADDTTNQKAVCYFRGDVTLDTNSTNLGWNIGTIIFDLGGNTLYQANSKYLFPAVAKFGNRFNNNPELYSSPGYFEVKNGNIVLDDKGLFEISAFGAKYKENATDETYKKFYYSFDGVNISLAPGSNLTQLFGAYSESSSVCASGVQKMELSVKFEDSCTIDISNAENSINLFNANDSVTDGVMGQNGAGKDYYAVNTVMNIEVGTVKIIAKDANFTWYTVNSANGSKVVFVPNGDGEFFNLTVPVGTSVSTAAKFTDNYGNTQTIAKIDTNASSDVYSIPSLLVTPYGSISSTYKQYDMIIFKLNDDGETYSLNGTIGYTVFGDALNAAQGITKANANAEVVVFFLNDVTFTNYVTGNFGYNIGKIVLDLNNHTITAADDEPLIRAYAKYGQTPTSLPGAYYANGYYEFKNGDILLGSDGLFRIGIEGEPYDTYVNDAPHYKTLYWTFDNVHIKLSAGATVTSIIGEFNESSHCGKYVDGSKTMALDVTFNDNCSIDITNAAGVVTLFNANDINYDGPTGSYDYTNSIVNVTVGAIEIIAGDRAFIDASINTNNGSSVTFVKDTNGQYATLVLKNGTTPPALIANGGSLGFVKVGAENGNSVYTLAPADALSFVPKMSLTLDRDLILNVYVPAKVFLNSFTLDGVEYTDLEGLKKVTVGEDEYYIVKISLDAKSAARDVVLSANVTLGEKSAVGTFKFGIIKYAEKLLVDGSDVEKTLVKDVLSYVRAAYTYFGTDDAATVSKIDAILVENYDANNAPSVEGSATAETAGLKSATFVLDGTPAMRFYLTDGADAGKYAFYIDGTRVNTETDENGTYIDIDVYAYALCETVTYTIDGTESGSFHIRAYYEWCMTQNDENLTNLVSRFWKYLQSARAYRDSVVEE